MSTTKLDSPIPDVMKREQKRFIRLLKELNLPISERVKNALKFWNEGNESAERIDRELQSHISKENKPW